VEPALVSLRRLVVDFLFHLQVKLELSSESLHKAVFYLDRFLSRVPLNNKEAILAGSPA
jgi:hypothetical protein